MSRVSNLSYLISVNLVFLVLLLIILISSFLGYVYARTTNIEDNILTYQYLSLDTNTNEASRGFVSFPDHVIVDKFFNEDEEGVMTLISKPGDNEYQCTGTCYCEKPAWRRNSYSSSNTISKSFTILVGAVSSLFAYRKTVDYFDRMCSRRFFQDYGCDEEDVFYSHVEDSCADLSVYPDELKKMLNDSLHEPTEHRKYVCKGNCLVRRLFLNIVDNPAEKVAAEFGCEEHGLHHEVNVELIMEDEEMLYDQAFNWFIYHLLEPMCRGLGHYVHNDKMYGVQKETYCVGSDLFVNPTVICRKDGEEFDYSRLEKKKKKQPKNKKKRRKENRKKS